MVKKGQEQVSAMDSPLQGQPRDPQEPKIKHTGHGSRSQTRALPPSELITGGCMSKKGEHNNDVFDPDKARGPNKHEHSQVITTGSYKKPETYREQIIHHQNTDPVAQVDKNEWHADTRVYNGKSRADHARKHHRSGSDSNRS